MIREEAHRLIAAGRRDAAVAELEAAAQAGGADAALELAIWHLEGRLIERDLARSRDWFGCAGELGSAAGEQAFIAFLANGIGGGADWGAAVERLGTLAQRDERARRQCSLVERMELTGDGYPAVSLPRRQLSEQPEAWAFENFFSPDECTYLMDAARPLLEPSVIVDPVTGRFSPHPVRTSDGASFPWVSEDLVISALNRRIAAASATDVKAGEPLQVLRYAPGQEYRPHLDALPMGDNQRVLTMLVYLNGGYSGGETLFTRTGLKFAGRPGEGLLFRNALPGGEPDELAQHAGLPVTAGEKFIASRWIRERRFGPA
jgi:prolyl 4-hydroxylase